jgi:KUP system potassium uptake protein
MKLKKKVMYSILQKDQKRADIYWFVHVNILSEPYKTEYKVTEIIKDDLYRVDFNLGFREPTKNKPDVQRSYQRHGAKRRSRYYQSI